MARAAYYPRVFYSSGHSSLEAQAVGLAVGEQRRNVDLTLSRVSPVRISGKLEGVVGSTAAARVRLISAGDESIGTAAVIAETRADPSGNFQFDPVPPGTYTVIAYEGSTGLTFMPASGPPGIGDLSGKPPVRDLFIPAFSVSNGVVQFTHDAPAAGIDREHWAQGVVDARGTSARVILRMDRTATGAGTVRDDATAMAAPELWKFVLDPVDGSLLTGLHVGSLAAGRVSFRGVLPGRYYLRFTGPGRVIRSALWHGQEVREMPIDLSSGDDLTDLSITLTDKTAKLAGQIVWSPGGTGPGPVTVAVFPVALQSGANLGLLAPAEFTQTDTPGFSFEGLPAGDWLVGVMTPEDLAAFPSDATLQRVASRAVRVTLKWGETAAVTLHAR